MLFVKLRQLWAGEVPRDWMAAMAWSRWHISAALACNAALRCVVTSVRQSGIKTTNASQKFQPRLHPFACENFITPFSKWHLWSSLGICQERESLERQLPNVSDGQKFKPLQYLKQALKLSIQFFLLKTHSSAKLLINARRRSYQVQYSEKQAPSTSSSMAEHGSTYPVPVPSWISVLHC